MRRGLIVNASVLMILLAGPVLAPDFARAGVPRSCVHPWAHAIECPKDTRRVMQKVLPSARRRELWLQRPELEWTSGIPPWQRNQQRRRIREGVREETLSD